MQSLAVHRPGKPVPLQQDYAVISCGRPALPEEEAVTTSASGKGNAVTYDFIQPGKKGQDFKLISLIRRGQAAATASAAQVGAETALLLPEPALLTMRDEGFVLNSKELFFVNIVIGIMNGNFTIFSINHNRTFYIQYTKNTIFN